jgi:hypothetical protein
MSAVDLLIVISCFPTQLKELILFVRQKAQIQNKGKANTIAYSRD